MHSVDSALAAGRTCTEFACGLLEHEWLQRRRTDLPRFRYVFSLKDAIDDCPEYLVPLPTLEELGAKFGLRIVRATGYASVSMEPLRC